MQQRLAKPPALDRRDLAACRKLLANGSRTFFAASFLLPRRVREPATSLYAFCRLADDAVDIGGSAQAGLDRLRRRLDVAYKGEPEDHPADRAFASVVERYAIPRALPEALIEGFEWDAAGRRYETLHDVESYASRVAGTVGAMMSLLMGAREPQILARACDLGIAMQLTNIARDVGEDARAGRIYLPLAWMREAGIDPERWLERPLYSAELASVVERLLAAADALYRRSESGIARLPKDCQPGIAAARFLYAEIGQELIRQGLDSVNKRAVVTPARKVRLLLKAARTSELRAGQLHMQPLVSAAGLVSAAAGSGALSQGAFAQEPVWWNLPARFVRVIEMFERLERSDRERAAAAHTRPQEGLKSLDALA